MTVRGKVNNVYVKQTQMDQIASAIIKFSFIPVLIVAIYAAMVYRRLGDELRSFAWFVFLSGLVESISAILWFNRKNNMPMLHFYVAGGFVCLALFYQKILKGFIDRKIITGMLVTFLVFTVVNSLFVQPVFTFNSYALTVESVLIIILSIATYLLMMNNAVRQKHVYLVRSINWINSGLFLYYTSSLLIFYFGHGITLLSSSYLVHYTWLLHAFFSLVMYCCFLAGLWHRPQK